MNASYEDDLRRYGGQADAWHRRFHYYLRKAQAGGGRLRTWWYGRRLLKLERARGIEIFFGSRIGRGLYLGHAWGITVNAGVVIGDNCNLHKGVTIGQENRGVRKGCPTLGNRVWVGINAMICGKIVIGDDVLIAPGAYVNCDVPSHSVVIGNPCTIRHKDNATEGYVNRCV